jgi:hypothetical protein
MQRYYKKLILQIFFEKFLIIFVGPANQGFRIKQNFYRSSPARPEDRRINILSGLWTNIVPKKRPPLFEGGLFILFHGGISTPSRGFS